MFLWWDILLSWYNGPLYLFFCPIRREEPDYPKSVSLSINTSLRIVLERTVASLAPKGGTKGPELRLSLLSTRRLPTPERSVVIPLTLDRKTNPFLPTNKSRTRLLWKSNSAFFYLPFIRRDWLVSGLIQLWPKLTSNHWGLSIFVRDRAIYISKTPLPWDLARFRYDEHTVYHLTIQLETLKSQQLVFHISPRRNKLLVWSITQNWWTEETVASGLMDSSAVVSQSLSANTYTAIHTQGSQKIPAEGINVEVRIKLRRHNHHQLIHRFMSWKEREGKRTCGNYLTNNPLFYLYGASFVRILGLPF